MDNIQLYSMDVNCVHEGMIETDLYIKLYGEGIMDFNEIQEMLSGEFSPPSKAILTCKYCGQWGALHCPCRYCGAPI